MSRSLYGLIRTSTDRQENSVQVQEELIQAAAARMDGQWVRSFIDAGTSATKVPFFRRKAVQEMVQTVQAGDCLIVWKLDRIARSMRDVCDLMDWGRGAGVQLFVLNFGEQAVDFSGPVGKIVAYAMTMGAELEAAMLTERIREAMAWRKKHNLPTNGAAPVGMKRVKRPDGQTIFVASDMEERHMAEALMRVERGEAVYSIARDFQRRGLKTADGKPYAHLYFYCLTRIDET